MGEQEGVSEEVREKETPSAQKDVKGRPGRRNSMSIDMEVRHHGKARAY